MKSIDRMYSKKRESEHRKTLSLFSQVSQGFIQLKVTSRRILFRFFLNQVPTSVQNFLDTRDNFGFNTSVAAIVSTL